MRKIITLAISLLCASAFGQAAIGSGALGLSNLGVSVGGGASYTFEENFEATGFDNTGWTKTVGTGGTVNEDNTTTPIRGTQDLLMAAGSTTSMIERTIAVAQTELWFHLKIKITTAQAAGVDALVFQVRNSTESSVLEIRFRGSGNGSTVQITSDPVTVATTATWTVDTSYHVWAHWKSDGTGGICFSESATKPAETTFTGGNTTQLKTIYLRAPEAITARYDQFIYNTTAIGDVAN